MPARWMGARLLNGSVALATLAGALVATATAHADTAGLRSVVLVGNSQSGTVSFLDAQTFAVLGTFDVIPDLQQRLAEMDLIQQAATRPSSNRRAATGSWTTSRCPLTAAPCTCRAATWTTPPPST